MEGEGAPGSGSSPWLRFIFGKNPSVTLIRIVVLAVASLIVFKFVLLPIRVTGESMFPTYKNGQIRLVNRLAYLSHPPERGDIVAVEYSRGSVLLKRIIGMPGERFYVFNGDVYINGQKLEEPYARGKLADQSGRGLGTMEKAITLEPSQYAFIGDNRPVSEGFFKYRNQIVGKIL